MSTINLEELTGQLESPDDDARSEAIRNIENYRLTQATPHLLRRMVDVDYRVRHDAARVLEGFHEPLGNALEELYKNGEHRYEVQGWTEAIKEVKKYITTEFVEFLLNVLSMGAGARSRGTAPDGHQVILSTNIYKVGLAGFILGVLRVDKAVKPLIQALEAWYKWPTVCNDIKDALRLIGEPAIEPLNDAITSFYHQRNVLFRTIFRQDKQPVDPQYVKALEDALHWVQDRTKLEYIRALDTL